MATDAERAVEVSQHQSQLDPLQTCGLDGEDSSDDSSSFECNICLEQAKSPVVTLCGHLYCWGCLYRWNDTQTLQSQNNTNSYNNKCPVCKANMDVNSVIPIYCRQLEGKECTDGKTPVPPRPPGQRPDVVARTVNPQIDVSTSNAQPGFFRLLIGINGGSHGSAMTPEQQHQAFLSRLLLLLGSFVILCLLLF